MNYFSLIQTFIQPKSWRYIYSQSSHHYVAQYDSLLKRTKLTSTIIQNIILLVLNVQFGQRFRFITVFVTPAISLWQKGSLILTLILKEFADHKKKTKSKLFTRLFFYSFLCPVGVLYMVWIILSWNTN